MFVAWLLSLTAAALFFAAGDVWGRQRKPRAETGEPAELATIRAELEATRAHMLEQERAKQELRARETQLSGELSQRRSQFDQLSGELSATQTRSEGLEHDLQSVRAELHETRTLSQRPPKPPAPAGLDRAAVDKEIARFKRDYELATLQVTQLEAERGRLTQQLELANSDAQTAALNQELSLTRETLNSRDAQLEQLREENTRLHGIEGDLERTKREVSELAEQTRLLRAEAFASHRPPTKRSERPVTISTRGNALQCIVDDQTEHGGASSAVIADELGLVVAASGVVGEYGDALAAFGAYLADLGTKTRDVLPLQDLQQVVVRDDHAMTLIVRPLATEDPGLALVTLGVDMNTAAIQIQGRPT